LKNPAKYARIIRKNKRQQEKNESETQNKGMKKSKNKTEASHSFFQSIVPFIMEMWTD
jgi:hypothetical protein